jgi:hypothetical protein
MAQMIILRQKENQFGETLQVSSTEGAQYEKIFQTTFIARIKDVE